MMANRRSRYCLVLLAVVCAGVPGCDPRERDKRDSLTVFVAASLEDVVAELALRFEQENSVTMRLNAGASGGLRRQIELGAPCDVFLSADAAQIDALERNGFLRPNAQRVLARNRLVIAFRAGLNPADTGPAALRSEVVRRIAVANPDYAPAGRYARQALTHTGCWRWVQPKIVLSDNARAAALNVAHGAVDAAVIYATDAAALHLSSGAYTFPSSTHDSIEYVGAVIKPRGNGDENDEIARETPALAQAFVGFLSGHDTREVWVRHGFAPSHDGEVDSDGISSARVDRSNRASVWSALAVSIRVSLLATGIMLLPGVWLGVWLARTRSRLRSVLEVAVVAPLVVPPVVVGFGLLLALRAINRDALFTWWAAALASALVAAPLLIRTVRATVEQTDARFATIAATLGASRWRIMGTITLPLAWRGILAGTTLAWARALGEFGATMVVAGNIAGRTRTLPLAIWTEIQTPGPMTQVIPFVVASVLLAVVAVGAGEWLIRRHAAEPQRARPFNP